MSTKIQPSSGIATSSLMARMALTLVMPDSLPDGSVASATSGRPSGSSTRARAAKDEPVPPPRPAAMMTASASAASRITASRIWSACSITHSLP